MTELVAWTAAVVFLALWLIEHVGGREAREQLCEERDLALDTLRLVMRGTAVHPRAELRLVKGERS
ncbi:hypothetical protein [Pimelobacter simplex]|uniref:hypothetical protein n=1 Tax=Nocardioides simplex TaxID=2045 RepID=UPI003AAB0877